MPCPQSCPLTQVPSSVPAHVYQGWRGKKHDDSGRATDEDEYCLYAANGLPGSEVVTLYDETEWQPQWLWAPIPVPVRDHRPPLYSSEVPSGLRHRQKPNLTEDSPEPQRDERAWKWNEAPTGMTEDYPSPVYMSFLKRAAADFERHQYLKNMADGPEAINLDARDYVELAELSRCLEEHKDRRNSYVALNRAFDFLTSKGVSYATSTRPVGQPEAFAAPYGTAVLKDRALEQTLARWSERVAADTTPKQIADGSAWQTSSPSTAS